MPFLFSKEKQNGDGSCLFANLRQKGVYADGRAEEDDLEGVEGGTTVIKYII